MALTLHAATIPSFLQILASVSRLIGKAESHCLENEIASSELLEARLAPDMLPFAYQVKSTAVHSIGAIEGVRSGVFRPDMAPLPSRFEDLRALVSDAMVALEELQVEELERFIGRPMRFEFGENGIDFTAEEFLLSFSQPNFYFHATTAYDILRMKGVIIGKRDFTGRVRKAA